MPEGIVQKFDICVMRRGEEVLIFPCTAGYRMLPGWVSLVDADGVEHCFCQGDGEGCVVGLEIRPVSPPQIVTPGGNGVLRG